MNRERIWAMTGQSIYEYNALCDLNEGELQKYCDRLRQQFASHAKAWSTEMNTTWMVRHYLALKYILAAKLKTSAAAYATDSNLMIVVPYLYYYLLFHTCRAFLLTRPEQSISIASASHSIIVKCTLSSVRALSRPMEAELSNLLAQSRSLRELFSYKFPASGIKAVEKKPLKSHVFLWAQRLAELAELQSECLTSALDKVESIEAEIDWTYLVALCDENSPEIVLDNDDHKRLGSACKTNLPVPLVGMATEGLTEDFFGAWINDDDSPPENAFDPDQSYGPNIFEHF